MRSNVIVLTAAVLLAASLGATSLSVASFEHATAQMSSNSSMMSGAGQNQSKMMMGTYGPNITGSVPLGPTIAKAIASKVNVTLSNLVKLRPGGTAQVIGPSVGTTYQAAASGMTTASVTFHYQSSNGGSASITKSFKFNII